MDNGNTPVIYARALLPEEVVYLQAKRVMRQAHERVRAAPNYSQSNGDTLMLPEEATYLHAKRALCLMNEHTRDAPPPPPALAVPA
ncbi:hypothetical protein D1007_38260 [Hordeum vulgare]|nr:hypothetical protein D1007_38260 [Hordeum vulgare]